MNPYFTIIIPVYNTEKTLSRTLDSVINQTFSNLEIIIINDCSTDNSLELINSYIEKDSRILLINNKKNSGLIYNRKMGIKKAKGEYCLFLDSDDWLELKACEILYNKLNSTDIEVLEFGYIREPIKEKSKIDEIYSLSDIMTDKRNFTIWNKAYKTELLKEVINNYESFYCNYAEDIFLSILISMFAKKFDFIKEYLHHYNLGTGISTQKITDPLKLKNICNNLKLVKDQLNKYLFNYDKEMFNYLDSFMEERYKFLYYFVNNDDNLLNTLENLKLVDNILESKLYNKKIEEIQIRIDKLNYLSNCSMIGKIKFVFLYLLKKIRRK